MFSYRLHLRNRGMALRVRFYCDSKKLVPKDSIQNVKQEEEEDYSLYRPKSHARFQVKHWNEIYMIQKLKRTQSFINSIQSSSDFIRSLQSLRNFPLTPSEFYFYLKRRHVRNQLIEQKYLPERVKVLRPDLAAAHFLVRRGGSVKFLGKPNWIGFHEKSMSLPMAYIPGLFIEKIKAEHTELYFEGLQNLSQLRHLTYLSLKNLDTVNDWFLDWISQEYCLNLKHLDISGCKNITYRGLSCFYRFENLETLEVKGVSDTPEFKLACLMLLDIMPNLDIKGIDLNIPEKIDAVTCEEIKQLQTS